ncbi:MAG: putative rane protein [Firmicutes bacterium]|nr:putative rane protein [Bacillota bacterium]
MKRYYYNIIILFMIIVICILFFKNGINVMKQFFNQKSYNAVVAIDAGHGGFDPGKIGVNHALEKDINLSIAYRLKNLLEHNDIKVIMTRNDDNGLYGKWNQNKKRTDMKKRISIINSNDAFIAVSIHQNSFTQSDSKGAQVFYYSSSKEGKELAEIIQDNLKQSIHDGNHRLAKSNNSYFMLKQTDCPLVIVECGFLSNWEEAKLLCEDSYQERMAWAIHIGIMEYINKFRSENDASAMNQ